jgi:hypothetical protein
MAAGITYGDAMARSMRWNKFISKTGIYKRGHCSFSPTKVTGPFLLHSKITSKNNEKLDLGLSLSRRKRIFFSFQRSIQIDLNPARSRVMARSD